MKDKSPEEAQTIMKQKLEHERVQLLDEVNNAVQIKKSLAADPENEFLK